MTTIQVLRQEVAAQIAAGEVIERPVSVVKELIENALDAGARRIDIDIEKGGMGLIRVTDDGSGMTKEDLALAFRRHATSKISQFNDLYALHSFGFRGEALASMVAVSQVKVISGQSSDEPAWAYTPTSETEGSFQKAPPLQGTVMEIRNLFYNVPARRKFVRTNSHESSRITHLVAMTALANEGIDFNLRIDGEKTFQTTNHHRVDERMILIYGDHLQGHLLHTPRREIHPGVFVEAWMSDSTIHRSNKRDISTFINGRYVESPEVNKVILEAYYSYIPDGKYPIIHLRLEVPPESLDVNIHPQKTSVQLQGFQRYGKDILDLLKDSLWEARLSVPLQRDPLLFETTRHATENSVASTQPSPWQGTLTTPQDPFTWKPQKQAPPAAAAVGQSESSVDLQAQESALPYAQAPRTPPLDMRPTPKPSPEVSSFDPASLSKADLKDLEPIGQLHHTFILAQNDQGLFIIDQHTCHERILYDRLKKKACAKNGVMQSLLLPETIDLSPEQEDLLLAHVVSLRDIGFLFEKTGRGKIQLLAVPQDLMHTGNFQTLINDILHLLSTQQDFQVSDLLEAVVASASCKGAVKAHGKLSYEEMKGLLEDLSQTDHPHTCPHGRPTVMSVTIQSLYKYFQRGSYDSHTYA